PIKTIIDSVMSKKTIQSTETDVLPSEVETIPHEIKDQIPTSEEEEEEQQQQQHEQEKTEDIDNKSDIIE
ncbi:unnamed protein product, partial [Rotaria sp. Silwood1]